MIPTSFDWFAGMLRSPTISIRSNDCEHEPFYAVLAASKSQMPTPQRVHVQNMCLALKLSPHR